VIPPSRSFSLHLAPMEGVVDFVLRDLITEMGGVDRCVTEFIRVTRHLHSPAILERYAPELKMGCRTRAGTPLFIQFLGGEATPMAENAAQAAELGALGIDLNFGCPAKTVNRHDGGASLLKTPERVFQITQAVRAAVPLATPVTVKIRLGFDDPSICFENVLAAENAGAQALTLHCRTKTDGYRPPAYWEWIPKIREKTKIPIVANGEIWTVEDFERCQEITGCTSYMLGRGAVARPTLFREIKNQAAEKISIQQSWSQIKMVLPRFFAASTDYRSGSFAQARTKQWLKALALKHDDAKPLFEELKVLTQPEQFRSRLEQLLS